ncbi:hypothetical protein [Brevibacillus sp. SYSU BS000544]|uniref:hypothetical protein n=1 Tax=Brevibacillus sp. SYSU BS000544 TaxID=3416443 RepID=UPI003CE51E65
MCIKGLGKRIRIQWIDKNDYHLRKVLLFKASINVEVSLINSSNQLLPAIPERLGLPTSDDGRFKVGSDYRVKNCWNIFALGDSAEIIDPVTGEIAGMTCKEAIPQAAKVGDLRYS